MKKRILLVMTALVLMLGCFGCKAKNPEESASTAEIVEGTQQNTENGDLPQQVKPSEGGSGGSTPGSSSQPSGNQTPAGDGQAEQTPGNAENGSDSNANQNQPGNTPEEENQADKSYNLKLMTFNIRYTDDPNNHSIDERAPRVKAMIEKHNPDVVGMQEVTPAWLQHLQQDYGEQFGIIMHYRTAENREGLAILYNKERFTLVKENFFWLSETPGQEGVGWDGSIPRICTWAQLKQKSTGKTIVYYNVHLDGTEQTNTGSYRLVNTEVKKNAKYPCFVGGDFNMNVGSEAHNLFISTMDEARIVVPNATSQPFTGTYAVGYPEIQPQSNGDDQGVIDFIFHQENQAAAVDYIVDQSLVGGRYPSDHFPLICSYRI